METLTSIRTPAFELEYEGRNITDKFDMYPTEITYTDKQHGESDEATVKVHNTNGLWLKEWAPKKGDKFKLKYGYSDQLVPAGEFTVDTTEASGDSSGDTVSFKGLATAKTEKLRTKNTKAYENQSLKEVVQKVASNHGYTVEGEIDDLPFERITQNEERDLEFLKRLADDYGHYFAVRGKKVTFTSRDGMRARDPIKTFDRTIDYPQTIKRYSFSDSDSKAAAKAEVSYYHPKRKKLVGGEASTTDDLGIVSASGDIVKLNVRVENEEQAKRLAKGRLDKKNAGKVSGDMDLVGDPLLCAGQIIELKNFGVYDGKWLIVESSHPSLRSGYETKIRLERTTDKQRKDGKELKKRLNKSSGADDLGTIGEDGTLTGGKK